jgi:hypothetical protein
MKLKGWMHTLLHAGCIALLLLQGYRIQSLRKSAAAEYTQKEQQLQARDFFAGETQARLDSCYNVLYPGYLRKKAEVTKK